MKENRELYEWQSVIVDLICEHANLIDSDMYQSLSEYDKNNSSKVVVQLPRGSGHTSLAAYIAGNYKSVIVYTDMDHWRLIMKELLAWGHNPSVFDYKTSVAIASSEIYQAIHTSSSFHNSKMLEKIKNDFKNKEVIVVDNASLLNQNIKDFILQVSEGKVIFLG